MYVFAAVQLVWLPNRIADRAPEIMDSGFYGSSVDMFSFGVVLFAMTYGLPDPFSGGCKPFEGPR